MKKLTYLLSLLAAVTLLVITNCKPDPDPDPDPVEEQLEKIGKTWTVTKVTLDGNDVTSDYDGMTLTITTSKGYSVSGGDFSPVWPSSGTFTFKNESTETPDVNTIIRQDSDQDIEISIVTVTETNLSLAFNYTLAGGRITGLEGDYVFDFQAQ